MKGDMKGSWWEGNQDEGMKVSLLRGKTKFFKGIRVDVVVFYVEYGGIWVLCAPKAVQNCRTKSCDWCKSSWNLGVSSVLFSGSRMFVGWFGIFMRPLILVATLVYIVAFLSAPPVDIDGIREPVCGSLLSGNNLISGALIPSSNALGLHFYPLWEAMNRDKWLYNGGSYQLVVLHFPVGMSCYLGREWEFCYRL